MKAMIAILSGVLLFSCCMAGCTTGGNNSSSTGDKTKNLPLYVEDYENLTYTKDGYTERMSSPFWHGNVIYNEIALPFKSDDGTASATLLYKPTKVISVMDQKLETTYVEGVDYTVDKQNGKLIIPEGSSIPLISDKADTGEAQYVPEGYERIYDMSMSGNQFLVWDIQGGKPFVYTESSYFYAKYLSITYAYDANELPDSLFYKTDKTMLYKLRKKLENGEDISLVTIGDSITQGCSSTGDFLHVAPNTPSYATQLKNEIERVYDVNVKLTNSGVGGTLSDYPLTGIGSSALNNALNAKPDLCVIAYGMNDSTASPVTNGYQYGENIKEIIARIRAVSPECNFILVNSFPCNPLYEREIGIFDTYLKKLKAISNENVDGSVAVVDMQSVGKYFLNRKKFCEISSSNVNHPNDFMHRVYCMNIMSVLTDYKK